MKRFLTLGLLLVSAVSMANEAKKAPARKVASTPGSTYNCRVIEGAADVTRRGFTVGKCTKMSGGIEIGSLETEAAGKISLACCIDEEAVDGGAAGPGR